jgi:hypothetical protein
LLDLLHLLLPESLQLLLLQMLVMKLWLHLLLQRLRNLDDQNKCPSEQHRIAITIIEYTFYRHIHSHMQKKSNKTTTTRHLSFPSLYFSFSLPYQPIRLMTEFARFSTVFLRKKKHYKLPVVVSARTAVVSQRSDAASLAPWSAFDALPSLARSLALTSSSSSSFVPPPFFSPPALVFASR